ncbi:MAG: type II toxin-antitoxin system HicA family toxin [Deltaproteobacteria bacterium]|nr:type II toxin-antitoxin system HicA family toxin [Deltaproteobacteria bacterium]MBI3017881.1 type II toxin-antitoxin system HicA family toxin [Deltaproteobacteria bacterium]
MGWYFLRQGKHEVWTNGELTEPIPRHKEIDEFTAKGILRKAQRFPGVRRDK